MANTNLPIDSLEFDDIKDNLKTYLKSQDQFKDYNFEGSGLNILLDILAYNTHYQAFYNNMLISEMFLDSAKRQDSVNSIAKLLNYIPKSKSAATAEIDLVYNGSLTPGENGFLPEGTKLTATIGDATFSFYTTQSYEFRPCEFDDIGNATKWIVPDILITEGEVIDQEFIYDGSLDCGQGFVIPDSNIDTSTIKVRVVHENVEDYTTSSEWAKAESLTEVSSSCKVYWLQAGINDYYEIEFGDNIIGQEPENDQKININYIRTSGAAANGIGQYDSTGNRTFALTSIGGSAVTTGYEAIVKRPAGGGSDKETICTTKRQAPKAFQTQNRAVTKDDYTTVILKDYPSIKSILVWGGEDNDPPIYGKVFLSAITDAGIALSLDKQQEVKNLLKTKTVLSIVPEFVDPDFTYLLLRVLYTFDQSKSVTPKESSKTKVRQTIQNYTDNVLEQFGNAFRYSHLLKNIDETDTGIISSSMSIFMQKRIDPRYNVSTDYTVKFADPIAVNTECSGANVTSNAFVYKDNFTSFLDDDGKGRMRVYYVDAGKKIYTDINVGTVDYSKGIVNLDNFMIKSIPNDSVLRLQACAIGSDITPETNQVLLIDELDQDSVILQLEEVTTPNDVC